MEKRDYKSEGTDYRSESTEDRSERTEDRCESTEDRSERTEDRLESTEDRCESTDYRSERTEDQSEQSDRSAEYVTCAEVEELLRSAYLAGRNEAVRAQIAEDSTIRRRTKEQTTTVEDILSGMRRSVWE